MASVNIITYNQLIQMFNDFADAHLQLNDFGNGPTSDIGTTRQMMFPYLWATHRSPSSMVISNRTLTPDLNFTFILVDQINQQLYQGPQVPNGSTQIPNGINSDNQQEVLSDMLQILQDLITYITTEMGQYGVKILGDSISFEPLFDETTDKVSGWITDITLQLKHSNCTIPVGTIFPPSSSCLPAQVYGNGVQILTIQSGSIGTFTIENSLGSLLGTWNGTNKFLLADNTLTELDGTTVLFPAGTNPTCTIGYTLPQLLARRSI